ncbi:MAG: arginine--tRNA ligase, partial [Pseudomonadota bacterium]|nr:arginine--tRNA ligase [Pseudomonadota bacterium]
MIESLLRAALGSIADELVPSAQRDCSIEIERARDAQHGDFATNLAMRLAKTTRQNPRLLAQALVTALPAHDSIAKVEIAGAGFINFYMKEGAYHAVLGRILADGADYGKSRIGEGRSVSVEFVSANPTGPLHVGHGRHAAFGASVANLLQAVGFRVGREYYVNDAGRQMQILAASTWLRYLEGAGERFAFPANGYRGQYIVTIAERLRREVGASLHRSAAQVFGDLPPDAAEGGDKDRYIDAVIVRARELIGSEAFQRVLDTALGGILEDIREDLAEFGVEFDAWASERALSDSGAVDRAVATLESAGHAYRREGALWFRSTEYGDEKDRVMVRDNGIKTYFASDLAYVFDKRGRGFDHLLYIWGADHHGYIARLRAGLTALGGAPDCFEVRLVQFVSLFRGGEKVQMSTRSGEFVTLRELRN